MAILLAGPTCSGKSALALDLATRIGGTVINTDSMQVYRELSVLTARPDAAELAQAPHRLYGVLPARETGSVAWWRAQALHAMDEAWTTGRVPILCGGTGLYFRALTDGLAEVPDPGADARAEARSLVEALGPAALLERLAAVDPDTAAGLRPTDPQRVARAWEVWRGTGRGLAAWRRQPGLAAAPGRRVALRLDPPRDVLRAAIAARFDHMVARGALEEVRALLALDLDPALPAMRAHGVPELAAVLRGERSLPDAAAAAIAATGRYTKRQATWFAHHPLAAPSATMLLPHRFDLNAQQSERSGGKIVSFVIKQIDAALAPA
ncbi:tRNA isopentenyltransferase [Ameyamaea chiangmaiensis NBRC 103196]|nr:tRNA isopentenyltransferase [Ameyamaea chiangmaiensis NBRC 103196]